MRLCNCKVFFPSVNAFSQIKMWSFSGWGKLVFFDTEEYQIPSQNECEYLATVPKLGPQWKIIHDLKPTNYSHGPSGSTYTAWMSADCEEYSISLQYGKKRIYLVVHRQVWLLGTVS